jgi:hypothetical protein
MIQLTPKQRVDLNRVLVKMAPESEFSKTICDVLKRGSYYNDERRILNEARCVFNYYHVDKKSDALTLPMLEKIMKDEKLNK